MSRGYFGVGIYHPKKEVNVGSLWRSAYAFGAMFLLTIGPRYRRQASDTPKAAERHLPLFELQSIEQINNFIAKGCPLVGVEIDSRARDLRSYHHPHKALYLLGAEDHGLPAKVLQVCHELVSIPSQICLNVACAGSILMYDRVQKGNNHDQTIRTR